MQRAKVGEVDEIRLQHLAWAVARGEVVGLVLSIGNDYHLLFRNTKTLHKVFPVAGRNDDNLVGKSHDQRLQEVINVPSPPHNMWIPRVPELADPGRSKEQFVEETEKRNRTRWAAGIDKVEGLALTQ